MSPPSLERGVNSEMTRWGVVGHKLLEVDDDENSKVIVEPLSLVELVVDDRSCAIVEGDLQKTTVVIVVNHVVLEVVRQVVSVVG